MQLRPYQETALAETLANLDKRPVLVAPTGSGKTTMGVAVAQGFRLLWIAHRRELIEQAAERLRSVGRAPDIVCASIHGDVGDGETIVASVQTLARRKIPEADLTIIDECHHATSLSYLRITQSATRLLGLTATPFRLDGRGLRDAGFGAIVVAATPKELMHQGYLVRPGYWAPSSPDLDGIRIKHGDYDQEALALEMSKAKLVGDAVEHYKKIAPDTLAVAFCVNIEHSRIVAEAFEKSDIPAAVLSGETPTGERVAILEKFRRGEIKVIANCDVISEGFDLPEMQTVILLRPTKSLCRYIQMIGRALRPPGPAYVIDHANNYKEHGPVDQDIEYTLDAKIKKPKPPPMRTCPACYAILDGQPDVCPECGHIFEPKNTPPRVIEKEAGELVRISPYSERRERWYALYNDSPHMAVANYIAEYGREPVLAFTRFIVDEEGNRDYRRRAFAGFLDITGEDVDTWGRAHTEYRRVYGKAPEAFARARRALRDPEGAGSAL